MELASHTDIQAFLLQVAVLLFTAKSLGHLCVRFGQPAVIGEILSGILLGPSVFGFFLPDLASHFLPSTAAQKNLLESLSLMGVIFLLFVTGLEIDLKLIKRQLRTSLAIALGGLCVTLTTGFIFGLLLPESALKSADLRVVTACFVAIAMAISALPVVARVLIDLGLTRRNIAQTLFATAMIIDAVGWVLLSGVIGLASTKAFSFLALFNSLFSILTLSILSLTVGKFLISKLVNFLFNRGLTSLTLPYMISLIFLWGWFSQTLHLEAIFGAFILGIIFSLIPKLNGEALHTFESITNQFFSPLFFALAGLNINLVALGEPKYFKISILFVVVSMLATFVSIYSTARIFSKLSHWSAVFVAFGLNARGSIGIIIASLGLSLGILTPELYAVLVLMAVVTSMIAPPALRYSSQKIEPDDEEKQRLNKEAIESVSFLSSINSVLLPLRPRTFDLVEAYRANEIDLYQRIRNKSKIEATLLSICNKESELKFSQDFLDQITKSLTEPPKKKLLIGSGKSRGDLILDEANKGYDLIILGVTDTKDRLAKRSVFSPMTDYVIRMSNSPVILIQGQLPDFESPHGIKILVPTGGSVSAKASSELAFLFLENQNSELHLLNVVEESNSANHVVEERQIYFGKHVLEELKQFSAAHGVNAVTELQIGPDPETMILETIIKKEIDLLILGTRVRPVGERLHLGSRIERLVREARCPVIVVNT